MPAEPEAFLKDLDVDFLPGLLYIFVRSQGTNEKRCKIFNAGKRYLLALPHDFI